MVIMTNILLNLALALTLLFRAGTISVTAAALSAYAVSPVHLSYEGIQTDNHTGDAYALYTHVPKHSNAFNSSSHAKRWDDEPGLSPFGGKWEHCEIYEEPNNSWGCHSFHSFVPWLKEIDQDDFPRILVGLLKEAFGNFERPDADSRAICVRTPEIHHRFCVSWAVNFRDIMTWDTMVMLTERVRECASIRDSAQGWVRFKSGADHVLCFSSRPGGCRKDFCPGQKLISGPEPDLDFTHDEDGVVPHDPRIG